MRAIKIMVVLLALSTATKATALSYPTQKKGGGSTVTASAPLQIASGVISCPMCAVLTANGSLDWKLANGNWYLMLNNSIGTSIGLTGGNHLNVDSVDVNTNTAIQINSAAAAPACTATFRGAMYVVQGITGTGATTDTFQICLKSAADTYAWKTIVTGG